jgi:hypothetical protein
MDLHTVPLVPLKAVPHDLIAYAARDIETSAQDLMRVVQQTDDLNELHRLRALATLLRAEVDAVVIAVLARLDDLTSKH